MGSEKGREILKFWRHMRHNGWLSCKLYFNPTEQIFTYLLDILSLYFIFLNIGNYTVATALAFFYAQHGLNTQITITFLLNLIELNRQFNIALNR
jgi:hypothetical protein